MKDNIRDIQVGDLLYSKNSKRFGDVVSVTDIGFTIVWNRSRLDIEESRKNTYYWADWFGPAESYPIFDTDNEKLAAKLKYES